MNHHHHHHKHHHHHHHHHPSQQKIASRIIYPIDPSLLLFLATGDVTWFNATHTWQFVMHACEWT
jgi:hypothetical protein